MDALSRLLALFPMRAGITGATQLQAQPFDSAPAAAGVMAFHLIVSGNARLDTKGCRDKRLVPGDIVLFPHGAAHLLRADDGSADTVLLHGHFTVPAEATLLLDALPTLIFVAAGTDSEHPQLASLVAVLRAESDAGAPGGPALIESLLPAMFALMLRAWLQHAEPRAGVFAILTEGSLQAALLRMLAEPEKTWSLQDFAVLCQMSRAKFARVFRRVTQTTPLYLLMQLRLAQAAMLLRTDHPIDQIHIAVGYRSGSSFNHAFKRAFGKPPATYRRQLAQSTE